MYGKRDYEKKDSHFIWQFIQEHPFATFVLKGDRLLATHIPVMISGEPGNFILFAHIAHNNPQISHLSDGMEALIIFHGPDAYISSSWYDSPDVSTWDYSAVHVNGKIKIQAGGELMDSLKKLVDHFEESQENPLFFDNLPKEIVEREFAGITGFWLYPDKVSAIAKLSQNKGQRNINSIVGHLNKRCPHNRLSEEISTENKQNDKNH